MRFPLILLALTAVSARAELTCLTSPAWSSIVGLVCHFAPNEYDPAERARVAAVQSEAASLRNVAVLELVRVPVTVDYERINIAAQQSSTEPGAHLGAAVGDRPDVAVRFPSGTGNQRLQVYELTHWDDVSNCLMVVVEQVWRSQNSPPPPSNESNTRDLSTLASKCVNDRQYTKLAFDAASEIFQATHDCIHTDQCQIQIKESPSCCRTLQHFGGRSARKRVVGLTWRYPEAKPRLGSSRNSTAAMSRRILLIERKQRAWQMQHEIRHGFNRTVISVNNPTW